MGVKCQLRHGVKVSLGMGLLMLHKMFIQRHKASCYPFLSSPFHICCSGNWQIETNVLNQQERSSQLHPFPFVVRVDS
jgi:hypothetical protein